jgi:hypothetical protein
LGIYHFNPVVAIERQPGFPFLKEIKCLLYPSGSYLLDLSRCFGVGLCLTAGNRGSGRLLASLITTEPFLHHQGIFNE